MHKQSEDCHDNIIKQGRGNSGFHNHKSERTDWLHKKEEKEEVSMCTAMREFRKGRLII